MDAPSPDEWSHRNGSRHAVRRVFNDLRGKIISLTLAPGTTLSRKDLQDQFGVSSTPIRDALLRLQEEELVDVFPQSGTVVSRIDLDKAQQAQFLRRSIEQEAVRLLSEAPRGPLILQLRKIIDRQEALARIDDFVQFAHADEDFHWLLLQAAGAPDLYFLVRRQSGQIDRLRNLHLPMEGKASQIVRDHRAIVAAIEAGRPDDAQRCVRDHLSRSIAFSGEIRGLYPDYFCPEDR